MRPMSFYTPSLAKRSLGPRRCRKRDAIQKRKKQYSSGGNTDPGNKVLYQKTAPIKATGVEPPTNYGTLDITEEDYAIVGHFHSASTARSPHETQGERPGGKIAPSRSGAQEKNTKKPNE